MSSASARIVAAPASAIQRALAVWWSADACGYGIRIAGRPYWASSNTEPPARATARSEATSACPNGDDVFAQVVVLAGRSQLGEVARAGHVEDVEAGVGERLDRREVDRARAERAAEDQHAGRLRRDAELGAGGGAVVDGRRDGAAGDEVAVAVAAGDREGEADAAGARREQAVGEAEVGVGLGQDDGDRAW